MVRLGCALLLLAGCGFDISAGAIDAPTGSRDAADAADAATVADADSDAAIDSPLNTTDASQCYGTGLVTVCLTTLPTQGATLATQINTGVDAMCTQIVTPAAGPQLCVIAGTSVTVTGTVVAIGARPLVVIGTQSITIPGTLDVSSTITPRRRGAGANFSGCVTTGMVGGNDRGGGGGGAGGSFGTIGGNGGTGDLNQNNVPAGVASPGVAVAAQPTPTFLRGGCSGGTGGQGDNNTGANPGGPPGDSGGAVYLIAGSSITIPGSVFASGAGGGVIPGGGGVPGQGGFEQGGGGAGAGGMIGLDAPTVNVSGRVVANGGGGGGGGGFDGGTFGGNGTTMAWNARAAAGIGDHPGSADDGGPGSARGLATGLTGVTADAGGGGGGGGLGVVWIDGTLQNGAMISPAPTAH